MCGTESDYNLKEASESFDNLISSEGFEDMMKKSYPERAMFEDRFCEDMKSPMKAIEALIELLVTCDGRGKEVKRIVLKRLIKRRYRKYL